MSALGQKRSFSPDLPIVRFAPKADIASDKNALVTPNENGGTMAAVFYSSEAIPVSRPFSCGGVERLRLRWQFRRGKAWQVRGLGLHLIARSIPHSAQP